MLIKSRHKLNLKNHKKKNYPLIFLKNISHALLTPNMVKTTKKNFNLVQKFKQKCNR